eukprot:gb/GECG01005815.1/.p1 GENE.gb/GECG01005815.1/~~gb/GECG01005815.1/.p1  ORF type:complete len:814 (+),score=124.66 gb/GECG01005815.1/:1-2442(+)
MMKRGGGGRVGPGGQYDGKESGASDQQYRQQQQYSSNIQQQQQQQRAPSPAAGANAGPTFEDLTIDECLNDVERIVRYATSNIALQRLVHVKMLAETAQSVGFEKTKEMLFPLLETIANDNEFVLRQHFAYQLNGLAHMCVNQGGEEGYNAVLEEILPLLSTMVADRQAEVRISAGESLVSVAKYISGEDLGPRVLTIVLQLAHDDEMDLRMTAAVLFNALAEVLGPELCLQFVIPEIVALAEDPVFRVRKAAAMNMDAVCRTAGPENALKRLIPVFQQLARDDIWGVRKACAESLMSISRSIDPQARVTEIVPIFESFINDTSNWVRHAAVQHLGPFLSTLPRNKISSHLVSHYTNIALRPPTSRQSGFDYDQELVAYCAFAFPAVALTLGKERWSELRPLFEALYRNHQKKVRKPIAYSLHEIARILGTEKAEKELTDAFDMYMRDVDEVRAGVVTHLADFLEALPEGPRESYLAVLEEIPRDSPPLNWRFRYLLASQLQKLAKIFSSPATYSVVVPLAFTLLQDPVACVRETTAAALAPVLLRFREAKREENDTEDRSEEDSDRSMMMENLLQRLKEWAKDRRYGHRLSFIKVNESLIKEFPQHTYEHHFMKELINLSQDRVSNVRLGVAKLLNQVMEATYEQQTDDSKADSSQASETQTEQEASHTSVPPSEAGEQHRGHAEEENGNTGAETAEPHEGESKDASHIGVLQSNTYRRKEKQNFQWFLQHREVQKMLENLRQDNDPDVRRFVGGDVEQVLKERNQRITEDLRKQLMQAHATTDDGNNSQDLDGAMQQQEARIKANLDQGLR